MESSSLSPYTVVLETTEPFGPETRIMHEKGVGPEEAALRVLHHWHNDMDFDPGNRIKDLEDGSVRVLAVLQGHAEKKLVRNPSGRLV
jgi:hypothetical protein